MVAPALCSSRIISKICSTRIGARPIDGSSSIRSFGSDIMARPMASICCSPPESVPLICLLRSFRRGKSSYTCSRLPSMELFGRVYAPISRFSSTVICANTRRPSGHCARPSWTILLGAIVLIGVPINSIVPVFARSRPEIVFRTVLLPAPFAPISVTISPSLTSRETPLTA